MIYSMGLTEILYPEQKKILECWNQVKSIGYFHEEIAFETILFSVFKAIQRNEKSIIIIPALRKRQRFAEILNNSGISALCLEFDSHASVLKEDVKQLQRKLSVNYSEQLLFDSETAIHTISHQNKIISDILFSFHGYESDRNFQYVLDRLRFVMPFKHINLVSAYPFELLSDLNEKDFDVLYDLVVKASMLYKPGYYHGRNYRNFNIHEKYIATENKINEFINKMSGFIGKFEQLRDAYYLFFRDARLENLNSISKKYRQILKETQSVSILIQSLASTGLETEDSPIFRFFGVQNSKNVQFGATIKEQYMKLEKSLRELPEFILSEHWPSEPLKYPESTVRILENTEKQLDEWYKSEREKVNSNYKYSNIFNQKEKDRLADLESQFFDLVRSFNDEKLLDRNVEINTISLQKQTELINSILLECNFLYSDVLENSGFYTWDAYFHGQSSKAQHILEWLKNFPSEEWPNIFEYIYLQKWIEDKISIHAAELPELLTRVKQEADILPRITGTIFSQKEMRHRQEIIKNLNSNDKNLYKNIQSEKGLEKLHWRYFFENNGRFWGSFFNIVLTSDDYFQDLEPGIYTNLIYFDHDTINPEVLHLGNTIHSYFHFSGTTSNTYDLLLEAEKLKLPVARNKPSVEMLQSARALAKTFVSVRDTFSIFQTKNANIISCLHPVLNSHILSHLRNLGIKELHIENNHVERLMECMIETSRKPQLLIQDYLINPLSTENLASQMQILESFKKMSYDIYAIESAALADNFGKTLQRYIEALNLGKKA